jgi:hypothetical protein
MLPQFCPSNPDSCQPERPPSPGIARRAVLGPALRRARHGRGCQRHGDRRHEVTPVAAIAAPAIIPATPIAESAELELGQDLGRLEEANAARQVSQSRDPDRREIRSRLRGRAYSQSMRVSLAR